MDRIPRYNQRRFDYSVLVDLVEEDSTLADRYAELARQYMARCGQEISRHAVYAIIRRYPSLFGKPPIAGSHEE